MGGEVFVGIKVPIGIKSTKEYCFLEWTNVMPYVMADTTFYEQGEGYEKYLATASPDHEWPECKSINEIEPSEYGVILFDFPSKTVFSRQRYSGPGQFQLYQFFEAEGDHELVDRLLRLNAVKVIKDIDFKDLPIPAQSKDISERAFCMEYEIPGWTFDHNSVRGREVWEDVRTFLKEHDWKSPVQSVEQADSETAIALMGFPKTIRGKKNDD